MHLGREEDALCSVAASCITSPYIFTELGAEELAGDPSLAGTSVREFGEMIGMTEEAICGQLSDGFCLMPGETREVTTMDPPRHGTPMWSVLRTGTGDLQLLAARDVQMRSVFGVYTAGTLHRWATATTNASSPSAVPERAQHVVGPAAGHR